MRAVNSPTKFDKTFFNRLIPNEQVPPEDKPKESKSVIMSYIQSLIFFIFIVTKNAMKTCK